MSASNNFITRPVLSTVCSLLIVIVGLIAIPILPIEADVLALTAIAAFRPRRWRGALLPKIARVRFDVIEPQKRPVVADADSMQVADIDWVEITSEPSVAHRLLFDPGHGLEERLISEQFT